MAQGQVKWIDKLRFVGVDSSKHSIVMSAQDEENGTGSKPTDLLLLAIGGCTAVDVIRILQKQRQELTGLEINLSGEQDPDPPWTFRKINVEYVLRGKGLTREAVERAIELSEKKYCSVGATVSGTAQIVTTYRIEEE